MENPRPEKVAVVDEVKAKLEAADAAVLTEYRGLNVTATAQLRAALREAGGEYKIYKNTLVRFAARDLGLDLDDLLDAEGDAGAERCHDKHLRDKEDALCGPLRMGAMKAETRLFERGRIQHSGGSIQAVA